VINDIIRPLFLKKNDIICPRDHNLVDMAKIQTPKTSFIHLKK